MEVDLNGVRGLLFWDRERDAKICSKNLIRQQFEVVNGRDAFETAARQQLHCLLPSSKVVRLSHSSAHSSFSLHRINQNQIIRLGRRDVQKTVAAPRF
jgi:hypothetical protein